MDVVHRYIRHDPNCGLYNAGIESGVGGGVLHRCSYSRGDFDFTSAKGQNFNSGMKTYIINPMHSKLEHLDQF